MNRLKLFIENFIIYGLGGVIGKMIPFFMLPIITRLIPDSYYMGLNDMSNTILSFAQAVAVLGMYDAMFRMFFEKEDQQYKEEICSSALFFVLMASLLITGIMIMSNDFLSVLFLESREYDGLITITALAVFFGATNSLVAAPTRMQNKRRVYLFTNFFTSAISYTIAVALLIKGEYIFALPLGRLLAAIFTGAIFLFLNRKWFSLKHVHWDRMKVLLSIGLPLMPNFLIYWIFNSSDRLMISKILGMEYTGIYAVGAKFGQLSQLIYTAFAGGWQYFAFSTMRDRDQVELTSHIFEYLGTIAIAATILVSLGTDLLFVPLFGEAYAQAAVTVPYLFMAPLVQMLFQIVGNQFLVIKKTWPASLVLCCGAVGNVVLNAILIPRLGIEGAAMATLAGFCLSAIVGVTVLQNMKLFQLPLRFLLIITGYLIYFLIRRLVPVSFTVSFFLAILVLMEFAFCYKKDIQQLWLIVKKISN